MSKPINPETQTDEAEPIDPARRRLLGMAKYVPPVVLGVISLQQAGCQPEPSCIPDGGCTPSGNLKADPNNETSGQFPSEAETEPTK